MWHLMGEKSWLSEQLFLSWYHAVVKKNTFESYPNPQIKLLHKNKKDAILAAYDSRIF